MPREIPQSAIDLLSQRTAIDPFLIVKLPWGYYSDRTITIGNKEVKGKVLEISNLDEVLRTDIGGGKSGNVTVVLDDTDDSLVNIIEHLDIHKLPVSILQAFDGVSETFTLFDGQISSPIEWDEGQRTFKFDCMNVVEDFEVGFAPEDGEFGDLHESLVGKVWPTGFGTVNYVPPVPLQIMPATITADPFGLVDLGIFEQIARVRAQMARLNKEADEERKQGLQLLIAAAYAHFAGDEESSDFDQETSKALQDDATAKEAESRAMIFELIPLDELLADQFRYDPFNYESIIGYVSSMVPYLVPDGTGLSFGAGLTNVATTTAYNFERHISPQFKLHSQRKLRVVLGDQFPLGEYIVRIGDTIFDAAITADTSGGGVPGTGPQKYGHMKLTYTPEQFLAPVTLDRKSYAVVGGQANRQGFKYFPSGSQVTILSEYPLKYVCNTISSSVSGVYAYRSFNGLKKLSLVPKEYYTITSEGSGGGGNWFHPTIVTLKQSLSIISYVKNLAITLTADIVRSLQTTKTLNPYPSRVLPLVEWDDDIYVSYTSSVGPNTVDILIWMIDNFTTKNWDFTSFILVGGYLSKFPSNFVLFDKKNVLQQLNEIATQAMCIIYLKDNTFYLKYLPALTTHTDTITPSDVLEKTLSIVGTGTEELVTRYIATWRSDYRPNVDPNRIQMKTNVGLYGLHSENVDVYIYNIHYLVRKSLTYWLIRKSNTWKIINFKCPITKLNIDTLDTILINLPGLHISNDPVSGIVESAVYDSVNNEIAMTVWLPIKFGMMDQYVFAFPANATETDVYPTSHDISSGGGTGGLFSYGGVTFPSFSGGQAASGPGFIDENSNNINGASSNLVSTPGYSPLRYPWDGVVTGALFPYATPIVNVSPTQGPIYDYQLNDHRVKLPDAPASATTGSGGFPGQVTKGKGKVVKDGMMIKVDVYEKGLGTADSPKKPKNVDVFQLQLEKTEEIPKDTWIIVVKAADGVYYAQVPIWL